jgi:hypothetical protein
LVKQIKRRNLLQSRVFYTITTTVLISQILQPIKEEKNKIRRKHHPEKNKNWVTSTYFGKQNLS